MKVSNVMNSIVSIFKNPERYSPGEDATARVIRRLVSPCPVCDQEGLDGHTYAEIASQEAPAKTEALRHFCDLYTSRKWSELNQIHEFDGNVNDLIIYALCCARWGGCMLAIRLAADLNDPDSLESVIILDKQEVEAIRLLPINLLPVSKAEQI